MRDASKTVPQLLVAHLRSHALALPANDVRDKWVRWKVGNCAHQRADSDGARVRGRWVLRAAITRPAVPDRKSGAVGAREVDHNLIRGAARLNVNEVPVVGGRRRVPAYRRVHERTKGAGVVGVAAAQSALALLKAEARRVGEHLHLAADVAIELPFDCHVATLRVVPKRE